MENEISPAITFYNLMHDYSFAKEVIKILLDKGLFAVIAIVLSLYINKILENYKLKNSFMQAYFGYKLKAYNEIFAMLIKYYGAIKQLDFSLRIVKSYMDSGSENLEIEKKMSDEYGVKSLIVSYQEKLSEDFIFLVMLQES